MFSHKTFFFLAKRSQSVSAVRETLASISLLSFLTARPAKAVHYRSSRLLHRFQGARWSRIIKKTQVFSIRRTVGKTKKMAFLFETEPSQTKKEGQATRNIFVHCLCEIMTQNSIRFKLIKAYKRPTQLLKTTFE